MPSSAQVTRRASVAAFFIMRFDHIRAVVISRLTTAISAEASLCSSVAGVDPLKIAHCAAGQARHYAAAFSSSRNACRRSCGMSAT